MRNFSRKVANSINITITIGNKYNERERERENHRNNSVVHLYLQLLSKGRNPVASPSILGNQNWLRSQLSIALQ